MVSVVAVWFLVSNFRGKTRMTFRAGCYVWVMLLAGISFIFSGMIGMAKPLFVQTPPRINPTTTATRQIPVRATPQNFQKCEKALSINSSMEGQTLCVYGVISYTREFYGASQVRFGGDNTFFFSSGTIYYPNATSGRCVYATGKVLLSSEQVPYIQVDKNPLYDCEGWMLK